MPLFAADLHIHTTYSDGELTPVEIVNQAVRVRGLKSIAITDHDSIGGVASAVKQAAGSALEVIPGVEMSAYLNDMELHILGLFIRYSGDSPLAALLEEMRKDRPERLLKMAEKLRSLGVKIRDDDLLGEIGNSETPGRAHIAAALVKSRAVSSMNDAFVKYIGFNGPGYVHKKQYSPKQVVDAIHEADGVAIIAHPGQYKGLPLKSVVHDFNLDGIEVFHHSHNQEERRFFRALAEENNWLISGGSDYHGPFRKPGIEIGSNGVDSSLLLKIQSRLGEFQSQASNTAKQCKR